MKKFLCILVVVIMVMSLSVNVFATDTTITVRNFNHPEDSSQAFILLKGELSFIEKGCTAIGLIKIRRPSEKKWTYLESNVTTIVCDCYIYPLENVLVEYRNDFLSNNFDTIMENYLSHDEIITGSFPEDWTCWDGFKHTKEIVNFNYPMYDNNGSPYNLPQGSISFVKAGTIIIGSNIYVRTIGETRWNIYSKSTILSVTTDCYTQTSSSNGLFIYPYNKAIKDLNFTPYKGYLSKTR